MVGPEVHPESAQKILEAGCVASRKRKSQKEVPRVRGINGDYSLS